MSLRLDPIEYAALCQEILNRDGWKCRYCGFRNNLHVHHIIFRSDNGPDESWNLITLCSSCHNGVHFEAQDGIYGLRLDSGYLEQPADANKEVKFIRHHLWRPE